MRLYDCCSCVCIPASFRHEYGDEMRALFSGAGGSGRTVAIAALWVSTVGEVLGNAPSCISTSCGRISATAARMLRRTPASRPPPS